MTILVLCRLLCTHRLRPAIRRLWWILWSYDPDSCSCAHTIILVYDRMNIWARFSSFYISKFQFRLLMFATHLVFFPGISFLFFIDPPEPWTLFFKQMISNDFNVFQCISIGFKWLTMTSKDFKLFLRISTDFNWFRCISMTSDAFTWPHMASYDFRWFHMASNYASS